MSVKKSKSSTVNSKNKKSINKKEFFTNVGIVGILLLLLFTYLTITYGIVYNVNDDIALKAMASGMYTGTPSFHMIFSGFPFSVIITTLYKIKNTFDWYGLSLLGSMYFFLGCAIYYIIKNEKEILKKIIYALLIITGIFLVFNSFFVGITFTSVATFIATCCLILYLLPDSKIKNALIALGLVLSFGMRMKACAMVLIFFVPALFYKNYKDKKQMKKDWLFGTVIAVILILCFAVEKSFYVSEDWKEYLEYNNARSLYYDYYYSDILEKKQSDEILEMYKTAGFTDEEIVVLESGTGIALYDDIPQKMIRFINEYEKTSKEKVDVNKALKEIWSTKESTYYSITLVVLLGMIMLVEDKKQKVIKIMPFIGIQIILLMYLALNGRVPDRVIVPLFTCFVLTNIYIIMKELNAKKIFDKEIKGREKILLISLFIILLIGINVRIENIDKSFGRVSATMQNYFNSHPDNFYIYDNNELEKFTLHKAFYKNNFINMSGWTAFSPLHKEVIKSQNVDSLKELLFKENVYVVTKFNYPIENYQFIEPNVHIKHMGYIEDFYIYKFIRLEKDSDEE